MLAGGVMLLRRGCDASESCWAGAGCRWWGQCLAILIDPGRDALLDPPPLPHPPGLGLPRHPPLADRPSTGCPPRASTSSTSSCSSCLADVAVLADGLLARMRCSCSSPFNIIYSTMVHANLNWTFGPFRYLFASPGLPPLAPHERGGGNRQEFRRDLPDPRRGVRHLPHAAGQGAPTLRHRRPPRPRGLPGSRWSTPSSRRHAEGGHPGGGQALATAVASRPPWLLAVVGADGVQRRPGPAGQLAARDRHNEEAMSLLRVESDFEQRHRGESTEATPQRPHLRD